MMRAKGRDDKQMPNHDDEDEMIIGDDYDEDEDDFPLDDDDEAAYEDGERITYGLPKE